MPFSWNYDHRIRCRHCCLHRSRTANDCMQMQIRRIVFFASFSLFFLLRSVSCYFREHFILSWNIKYDVETTYFTSERERRAFKSVFIVLNRLMGHYLGLFMNFIQTQDLQLNQAKAKDWPRFQCGVAEMISHVFCRQSNTLVLGDNRETFYTKINIMSNGQIIRFYPKSI